MWWKPSKIFRRPGFRNHDPRQRKDIFDYSRNSAGGEDYLSLCKEILVRVERFEEMAVKGE